MRFTSFKKLSFGLALVSLAAAGGASAQSLVGVNTTLDRTLDSKSAAAGQVVTAKLDGTVTAADGTKLPKGTELIGKVADVKNANGATSVSLVFTSAKLKDGKEIPVKATVLAAYPELDRGGSDAGRCGSAASAGSGGRRQRVRPAAGRAVARGPEQRSQEPRVRDVLKHEWKLQTSGGDESAGGDRSGQ